MDDLKGLPHLVLNGGQTLPNVLALLELDAHEVIVVRTSSQPTEPIERACAAFGIKLLKVYAVPAYEVEAIRTSIGDHCAEIRQLVDKRKIVLNFTGGTKPMVLGTVLGLDPELVAASIYLDRDQLYRFPGSAKPWPVERRLCVTELLKAHAILESSRENMGLCFDIKPAPDKEAAAAARQIAANVASFEKRFGALRQSGRHLNHDSVVRVLRTFCSKVPPEPVDFANGTWLEVYVWSLLRTASAQHGISDVQQSVNLDNGSAAGKESATDLDVAYAWNNQLRFVSCKTGVAGALKDEVFHVAARQRQVGGTFGRGALLHWHPSGRKGVRAAELAAKQLKVPIFGRELLQNETALVQALVE